MPEAGLEPAIPFGRWFLKLPKKALCAGEMLSVPPEMPP